MLLEFDVKKLEWAMNNFYSAMGVSISIMYEDYSVLGSKKQKNPYCRLIQSGKQGLLKCMDQNCRLLERCKNSKKLEMQICHAGLVEIVVPILHGDDVVGYIMLGHIKPDDSGEATDYISDLPIDKITATELYNGLQSYAQEKLDSILVMADMFVKYIVTERFVKTKESPEFEAVRCYIYDNLDKKLTAARIARDTHLSNTALYNVVKRGSGHSVNEYINMVRIDKSKRLLLETAMTVEEIAVKLNFSSTAYYSKMFKKIVGVSPSVFRKQESGQLAERGGADNYD